MWGEVRIWTEAKQEVCTGLRRKEKLSMRERGGVRGVV